MAPVPSRLPRESGFNRGQVSTLAERKVNDRVIAEVVSKVAGKDAEARQFLMTVAQVARVVDDVCDADNPHLTRAQMVDAFFRLLTLPLNEFYRQHMHTLTVQLALAFNAWQDANVMQESGVALERLYAHVLRDYVNEICQAVALLTGGEEHMRRVSPEIRRVFLKEL